MRSMFLCGVFMCALLATSCSHYVGSPDDPPKTDTTDNAGDHDSLVPDVFLNVLSVYVPEDRQWTVTMVARSERGGPVVAAIPGALLSVNGNEHNLAFGFPYGGTPERLFVPINAPFIQIDYIHPRIGPKSTLFNLVEEDVYSQSFLATRSAGVIVTLTPAIRLNEIVEVRLFKSMPSSALLLSTSKFSDSGSETCRVPPSAFASQLGSDTEIIVEVSRSISMFRNAVFTRGIELTQQVRPYVQYVKVTE